VHKLNNKVFENARVLRKLLAIHVCLRVDRVMGHLNPGHIPTLWPNKIQPFYHPCHTLSLYT